MTVDPQHGDGRERSKGDCPAFRAARLGLRPWRCPTRSPNCTNWPRFNASGR